MLYAGNDRIAFLGYFFNTAFGHGVFIGRIDRVIVWLVQSDVISVNKSCRYEANPIYGKGNEKRRYKCRPGILLVFMFQKFLKDYVLIICFVIVIFQNVS